MKKFFSAVYDYVGHVGFYFLLTMLVFSCIAVAKASSVVALGLVWAGITFGILMGFADYVYRIKILGSYVLKAFIHTVLAVIAFAVAFVWVADVIAEGSTAVVGVLAFAVLMAVVSVIRCVIHSILARKENAKKEYEYLYTSSN